MMILYPSGTQDQIKIFHKLIWSLLFIKETEKALIYIYNILHLEKFIYVIEEYCEIKKGYIINKFTGFCPYDFADTKKMENSQCLNKDFFPNFM